MERIFLDTEFTELKQHCALISIALVAESGKEFYAEFTDFDSSLASEWVIAKVLPKCWLQNNVEFSKTPDGTYLQGTKTDIKEALQKWLSDFPLVEIWADVLAYDWVLFCELFGGALNLPQNIFFAPSDFSTYLKIRGYINPISQYEEDLSRYTFAGTDEKGRHNALNDARTELACWKKITGEKTKESGVHSVHTFMLPIRWDYLTASFHPANKRKGEIPFDERTDLQCFLNMLTPADKATDNFWERKFYRIDDKKERYNELVYYHAHAATNFFDLQREGEIDAFTVARNKVALYFELKEINPETDRYSIHVKEGPTGFPVVYHLKLSGISLHVFTTGICILSYTLKNDEWPEAKDILFINEFGRRIYPPFIEEDKSLDKTKSKVLADKIEISIAALGGIICTEDFGRYTDLSTNNIDTHRYENDVYQYHTIIDFPVIVKKLFNPSKFAFSAQEEGNREVISFRLLTSDRMFFQCWYGNDHMAETLRKEVISHSGEKTYLFSQCKFWYAFLYGDRAEKSLGIGNPYFMEQQLLANTYTRWAEYGTLYGFTNDSFVCISQSLQTLFNAGAPDLSEHMQSIYYTMAVLNLVQRSSALRFSGEVAMLADLGKSESTDISKRIQDLNLNYIEFINKVYYREISPEIQGIEIYNFFQKAMNIEADVNDLKMEIGELHNLAMILQQTRSADEQALLAETQADIAKEQAILNKIALLLLPATFVFSIMGSGFLAKENFIFSLRPDPLALLWILIGLSPSIVVFIFRKRIIKWLKSDSNV
ncbi:MAG: 3'-5' exoribonuclease [Ferruginibacter sp.]